MAKLKKDLIYIAQESRRIFERKEVDLTHLTELYMRFFRKKNAEDMISFSIEMFPNTCCYVATLFLKEQLKGSRYISGGYKRFNHDFLEYRGRILDITADQFGGPRIYVGPLVLPWRARTPFES